MSQVVEQVPKTIQMKLLQYLQDLFNILDVLGIFCFLAGFIVKVRNRVFLSDTMNTYRIL